MRQAPANLLLGLPFSLTLMFILFAHEMGHYLYARHYRVYATPPFFVPVSQLVRDARSVHPHQEPDPHRAPRFFDIGIAGPIAGFIPSCAALLVGLSLSRPLSRFATPLEFELGFPLAFHLAARLLHLACRSQRYPLHPIAVAGWVGMFATALNLLARRPTRWRPHRVFRLARFHRWVSLMAVLALVPLGKYLWIGWFFWAVLWLDQLDIRTFRRYPAVLGKRRCSLSALSDAGAELHSRAPHPRFRPRSVARDSRRRHRDACTISATTFTTAASEIICRVRVLPLQRANDQRH